MTDEGERASLRIGSSSGCSETEVSSETPSVVRESHGARERERSNEATKRELLKHRDSGTSRQKIRKHDYSIEERHTVTPGERKIGETPEGSVYVDYSHSLERERAAEAGREKHRKTLAEESFSPAIFAP